jgi:hypothetical protein
LDRNRRTLCAKASNILLLPECEELVDWIVSNTPSIICRNRKCRFMCRKKKGYHNIGYKTFMCEKWTDKQTKKIPSQTKSCQNSHGKKSSVPLP